MSECAACRSSQIAATEDMLQSTKLTSHVWRRHNLPARTDGSRVSMAEMLLKPDVTLQQVHAAQRCTHMTVVKFRAEVAMEGKRRSCSSTGGAKGACRQQRGAGQRGS